MVDVTDEDKDLESQVSKWEKKEGGEGEKKEGGKEEEKDTPKAEEKGEDAKMG